MPSVDPSFLNTASGQKMLAEAVRETDVFYPRSLGPRRRPHEVHYKRGQTCHVAPAQFWLWPCEGPTDCEWIVPGTL
jgi:hypothetical protein